MKKFFMLFLLLSVACMQTAFAYDAATIKIKVSGASHNNRYFLCLPNVGCLSIFDAAQGKVYPILHDVDVGAFYVTDVSDGMRVYPQAQADSCNGTVKTNQTITISGRLTTNQAGPHISQLHCSIA